MTAKTVYETRMINNLQDLQTSYRKSVTKEPKQFSYLLIVATAGMTKVD